MVTASSATLSADATIRTGHRNATRSRCRRSRFTDATLNSPSLQSKRPALRLLVPLTAAGAETGAFRLPVAIRTGTTAVLGAKNDKNRETRICPWYCGTSYAVQKFWYV